jgi:peptidyl-prolyl cis-trans isomerase B (cyclophilin B)
MADQMNLPGGRGVDSLDPLWRRLLTICTLAIAAFFAGWAVISYVKKQEDRHIADAWSAVSKFESSGLGQGAATTPPIESVEADMRPWARLLTANKPFQSYEIVRANLDEAKPLFAALDKDDPKSPAIAGIYPGMLGPKSVVDSIDAFSAWETANPSLLDNPPPAATDRARIVTDQGTIEIGFYPDLAPKHVENFRQLVKDGFYQKTKFHRVTKSGIFVVQGGDPNTIDQPVDKWGQGTKGDGVPFEKNRLAHVRGAVAMAQPGFPAAEKRSSGCQFYFVTKDSPSLNGRYTVFAKVISGMDVIDKIAAGENETGSDRPKNPTIITKTEIY